MIQALIAPIAELAGGWLKGKADANAVAANLKLVEAEAKAAILKSEKTSLAEWEKLMAQGAQHSWKDEFFSLILAAPCILEYSVGVGPTDRARWIYCFGRYARLLPIFLGMRDSCEFRFARCVEFWGK